jgi:hypothetical protein
VGWEAFAGLVVGALLGLLSALAIEVRRERRDALRAARIIQTELLNIGLLASGSNAQAPFPYPLRDTAWRSHQDRLAGAGLSDEDWITLSSFYVTNDLVEKGAMTPATCAEVDRESRDAGRFWPAYNSDAGGTGSETTACLAASAAPSSWALR